MKYLLNRPAFERAKSLVRDGAYVDRAWSFTPADSNALLGDPPNWTEFRGWFLGAEMGKPDQVSATGVNEPTPDKSWWAYPFGKGEVVNLNALRAAITAAKAGGDGDVATAAQEVLDTATAKDQDLARAGAALPAITFTAPVTVRAAAGNSKTPTFDMDAYTGGAMNLDGWDYPVVVDLQGLDFTKNARPILKDHDPAKPLGHTTNLEVRGVSLLYASGPLSGLPEFVQPVVDAAAKGFPWQASIGATPIDREFVPAGQTATANGKTFAGPINIARRSSLREISILSLGADDDTRTRIAARAAKGTCMKSKFAAWAKDRNLTLDGMDDAAVTAFKSAYKASVNADADDPSDSDFDAAADANKPAACGAANAAIRASAGNGGVTNAGGNADIQAARAEMAEERKRMQQETLAERQRLRDMVSLLDEYRPQLDAEKYAPIEAKAISGDYDRNRTELELIKARRPQADTSNRSAPYINTGASSQIDGTILAAATARSMGVGEKAAYQGLDERGGNIAASIKGFTLHRIIAMSAARFGLHVSPGMIDDDFLRDFIRRDKESHSQQIAAYRAANPLITASSGAGFSTMSLTGITENVLWKAMLESYNLQATVVSDIAFERDANDLKPYKVYRLTGAGDFQPVGPTGQIHAFGLQDESYTGQVQTKATLLQLKREDILNDDMGALMQAPQALGRKAALNREKTVITTLLSGLTTTAPGTSVGKTANGFNFFSAGAKNFLTGGTSALNIGALTTAEQTFLQQKDANGDPIGLIADRLLVPPELKTTALNLFNGANLVVTALGSTSSKETSPNYNAHAGRYKPLVSPFLGGASSITGASATQWMLLPPPTGGMATVQVGYLRGQRTPVIRQVEVDAMFLGLAYQAVYDFGVSLLDYRCGVYSAGA